MVRTDPCSSGRNNTVRERRREAEQMPEPWEAEEEAGSEGGTP